jgi:hypothetical protein
MHTWCNSSGIFTWIWPLQNARNRAVVAYKTSLLPYRWPMQLQSNSSLHFNWKYINGYSHEDKAPKCAKSIQYVVEKNIQPWISWSDSSLCSNWNHSRPARTPNAIVCTQFNFDNILGRASWKLRCDNTCQKTWLTLQLLH